MADELTTTVATTDLAHANLARYAAEAQGAFASNTVRALRADTAVFTAWGVVRIQVTRDAGLAVPGRMMAPSRFQRWCEYGPRYRRCSEAAREGPQGPGHSGVGRLGDGQRFGCPVRGEPQVHLPADAQGPRGIVRRLLACRAGRRGAVRGGGDQDLAAPGDRRADADLPQLVSRRRRVPARPAGRANQPGLRPRRAPGGQAAGERDQPGPGPVRDSRGLARRDLPGRHARAGRRRCPVNVLLSAGGGAAS